MYFHRSNRAERLLDALAELVGDGTTPVFAPETVVLQSRGMERWVAMELSQRLGIWANGNFPFPRAWLDQVTDTLLPHDASTRAHFSPEAMQWSIAALLPTLITRPELAQVAAYLRDDLQGRRELDLARETARLFDQYVVFRPKLIAQWERGEDTGNADDDWQAVLWRALIKRNGPAQVTQRTKQIERVLSASKPGTLALPKRVSFFAISTLPPLYIDLLSMLARHVDVHWFLLSPSREYWMDIRPQREIWSALHSPALAGVDAAALHLSVGHPLLASWGRVAKDLLGLIEQRCTHLAGDDERYEDPGTDSLLHTLQSDMLHLRARGETDNAGDHVPPLLLSPQDNSLSIHACHSEMREVDVLHDQLCALLEADPTLRSQDILVMAPDIDRYAPLIDAVFSRPNDPYALAYQISERKAAISRPTLNAFNALLEALASRLATSTVLDLLSIDLIRQRFGIAADELEQVSNWLVAAGARWGVDEHHRAEQGQPALRQNTWRFALDRLLLGYAFDGEGHQQVLGVLPFDDIEGTDTQLLGRVVSFCDQLFALRERAAHSLTLPAWRDLLAELLRTMIDRPPEAAADQRAIHEAIEQLVEHARAAGFERTVPLASMQKELNESLERSAGSHGFLASGITFCRMVPMRSIPFRVIALLGMAGDNFPRADRPTGFDRMRDAREPGDRSARDDDRQLLLEIALSARDRLIVTYVGQSVQDNSARPPSVLIGELIDWCTQAFRLPDTEADATSDRAKDSTQARGTAPTHTQAREQMTRRLTTQHPLQPWSPRYFAHDDARLFSYARDLADGSQALIAGDTIQAQLFSAPLAAPPSQETIELRALEEAINDPVRTLLQQRLRIRLGDDAQQLDDREPMSLDGLDNWKIATPLIDLALRGHLPEDGLSLLRAGGAIPLGTVGSAYVKGMWGAMTRIVELAQALRHQPRPPLSIDVSLGTARISGVVRDRYAEGTVLTTYSKLDAGIELRAWIRHLAINAMHADESAHDKLSARDTFVVGRDEDYGTAATARFSPIATETARAHLRELIAVAADAALMPSVFERKRARAYALKFLETHDAGAALAAAKSAVPQKDFSDYIKLAWGERDPLDLSTEHERFARVALAVYGPLLEARSTS